MRSGVAWSRGHLLTCSLTLGIANPAFAAETQDVAGLPKPVEAELNSVTAWSEYDSTVSRPLRSVEPLRYGGGKLT
ncbi:MAG TPA: hypothetical protein VEQ63_06570 [Bryobacteraceae bacterium]|nr:hypothetical protein [Bryobacteraceae bacterium]